MKTKTSAHLPILPLYLRLDFTLSFPIPLPHRTGEVEMGYCSQAKTDPLCHLSLITLYPCSNMSLYYRIQSFRINLLQHGSSPQPQLFKKTAPTAPWVFHMGYGASGKDCFYTGSSPRAANPVKNLLQHRPQICQQISSCSGVGLHGLQCGYLFHHWSLHGLQGNLCSGTWSTSSFPSSDLDVGRVVSYSSFSFSSFFYFPPFPIKHISQRHHHLGCQAQVGPEVGQLEPAGTG